LQDVNSIYDIVWARDPDTGKAVTYGAVRLADELQFSVYNFEAADVEKAWKHLELCEAECQALLQRFRELKKEEPHEPKAAARSTTGGSIPEEHDFSEPLTAEPQNGFVGAPAIARFPLLPAYDLCLKCSHMFNVLDARGAISVTERVGVIARIRNLAVGIARAWIEQQKASSTEASPEETGSEAVARRKTVMRGQPA
jgi:glycyl-tRNA synthetase alpha chain